MNNYTSYTVVPVENNLWSIKNKEGKISPRRWDTAKEAGVSLRAWLDKQPKTDPKNTRHPRFKVIRKNGVPVKPAVKSPTELYAQILDKLSETPTTTKAEVQCHASIKRAITKCAKTSVKAA